MKKILITLSAIAMVFVVGCGGGASNLLTVDLIEPLLSPIDAASNGHLSNILIEKPIEYIQIGDPNYDDFFMASAKLNGVVVLSKGMTTTATGQLKKFAMSKASNEAMKENIIDLVGDTPKEQWTTEQSIAVMKMAKGQGQINSDEVKYFATTAGSIGIVVVSLGKGIVEAKELIPNGTKLLKNVKSVSPLKIPQATKGVKLSLENLNGVVKNAPKMLEEMKVLLDGFKLLS